MSDGGNTNIQNLINTEQFKAQLLRDLEEVFGTYLKTDMRLQSWQTVLLGKFSGPDDLVQKLVNAPPMKKPEVMSNLLWIMIIFVFVSFVYIIFRSQHEKLQILQEIRDFIKVNPQLQ
jgi:hypothetical protein